MDDLKKFLLDYYNKYKTFPKIDWLASKTNVSKERLIKILDKLVTQGYLGKNRDGYYVKRNEPVTSEHKKDNRIFDTIRKLKINLSAITFIRWGMLFIAFAAMLVSLHFTYEWLKNYLDVFYSSIFSFSIVAYGSLAPQAAFRFYRLKKYLLATGLLFTALIVIVISMLSTVAGQYKTNDIKKVANVETKSTNNVKIREEEKALRLTNIQQNNKQIEINQNRIDVLSKNEDKSTKEQNEYSTLLNNNSYLKKQRDAYQVELDKITNELKELYIQDTTIVNENKDFYKFVESVFPQLTADFVEMWGYLFFAVIADIIAPLGLAVFLGDLKTKEV